MDVILTVISGATVLGVILLRIRRPGLPLPFRVPLYPVPPVIYLLLTVWMAWSVFRSNPTSIILTLGTIGVTLAVWFGFARRHSLPPPETLRHERHSCIGPDFPRLTNNARLLYFWL